MNRRRSSSSARLFDQLVPMFSHRAGEVSVMQAFPRVLEVLESIAFPEPSKEC